MRRITDIHRVGHQPLVIADSNERNDRSLAAVDTDCHIHLDTAATVRLLPYFNTSIIVNWGTGIRGLMRGMATLPQGNQRAISSQRQSWKTPGELGIS